MSDVDPGFYAHLRECLSRHADEVPVDLALASGVERRSRQLARRGQALAAGGVAVVTAAIVVSAVMLGGSSPAAPPQTVHVQPAASVTATPSPSPSADQKITVCPAGKMPNLRLVGRAQSVQSLSRDSRGKRFKRYYLIGGIAIDGKPQKLETSKTDPTVKSENFAELGVAADGSRSWLIMFKSDAGTHVYRAKFVDCVKRR